MYIMIIYILLKSSPHGNFNLLSKQFKLLPIIHITPFLSPTSHIDLINSNTNSFPRLTDSSSACKGTWKNSTLLALCCLYKCARLEKYMKSHR